MEQRITCSTCGDIFVFRCTLSGYSSREKIAYQFACPTCDVPMEAVMERGRDYRFEAAVNEQLTIYSLSLMGEEATPYIHPDVVFGPRKPRRRRSAAAPKNPA